MNNRIVTFLSTHKKIGTEINDLLDYLEEEYAIKVKTEIVDNERLHCLNYDQISSPRFTKLVDDCRGLIIDDFFNIVCRPFTRFYNFTECPENDRNFNIDTSVFHEKADGSLMKMYHWNGAWRVGSRGTVAGYGNVGVRRDITFSSLFWNTFGITPIELDDKLKEYQEFTFLFEMATPLNRVVTPYLTPQIFLLAARHNENGKYIDDEWLDFMTIDIFDHKCVRPKYYSFDSLESASEAVNGFETLDEGFVGYDRVSGIRVKFKSPTYLRAHRIRGEGTPSIKNIIQLVINNEQHEYLSVFPDDEKYFIPVIDKLNKVWDDILSLWERVRDIDDQKKFAVNIIQYPYSAILFKARGMGIHPQSVKLKDIYTKILSKYLIDILDEDEVYML